MRRTWMLEISGGSCPQPFALEYDGVLWDCATDGTRFLMLRGATWQSSLLAPDIGGILDRTVFELRGHVDLMRLKCWAYPERPHQRYGFLAGIPLDRPLLYGLIAPLSFEQPVGVHTSGERGPLLLRGLNEWRAVIAPVDPKHDPFADAPRLELSP